MVKMLQVLPRRPSPTVCWQSDISSLHAQDPFVARDNDFDVVLVDTAGRMQDNEPLMRALAKVGLAV
jgi:signal recognition particle GTPase